MITKIEVGGYRLLDGFVADFRPLTVVIGANAVGKSTLLDCLQCVSQCVEHPLGTVLGWHWGMVSILNAAEPERKLTWKVSFRKPDSPGWIQLPIEDAGSMLYEVVLQADPQGQASAQYEVLKRAEPLPGYSEAFKYLEATPFRRSIYDRRSHQLVPFDEAVPQPNTVSETGGGLPTNNKALPAQAQEPTLMLSQIRFFNEFPIPSAARFLLASMAFYPGFDVTRFSALRTKAAEIRPIAILVPNGENLGTVLHEMLTRYDFRDAANDLRMFLKAAYPSFEEIHVDTTFGTPPQVLVRMREKGMQRSMELWELSDGMLRFLCLATALLSPLLPPLIAIDEPEVGLHPRLLPIVADMVKTASERTQVLVTTHSPDFLNRFDIADVAVMSRAGDKPRASWHRPADRKTLIQMLKAVEGETLGDLHRSGELEAIG
ncbi:MAG: AAA family ATPase [Planctomycetes bacterium]|nr:AAA family ATPase [Planctomycetota bacterium]